MLEYSTRWCEPGILAINPIYDAYPIAPLAARQVYPSNFSYINATSHEPAVLSMNGYVSILAHGVAGNTNPYPYDPCAKLWLTLTLWSDAKSIAKYCS